jgi:hypothetical protein
MMGRDLRSGAGHLTKQTRAGTLLRSSGSGSSSRRGGGTVLRRVGRSGCGASLLRSGWRASSRCGGRAPRGSGSTVLARHDDDD